MDNKFQLENPFGPFKLTELTEYSHGETCQECGGYWTIVDSEGRRISLDHGYDDFIGWCPHCNTATIVSFTSYIQIKSTTITSPHLHPYQWSKVAQKPNQPKPDTK
jgi:hypothetical protein